MTETKSELSVMGTSNVAKEHENEKQMLVEGSVNGPEKSLKMIATTNMMSHFTGDQRSTQSGSLGQYPTGSGAVECEMSAWQPETSLPTTPSMSNSPKHAVFSG
jgi:hypothetical protein